MPHWCINNVEFFGDIETLNNVEAFFKEMRAKQLIDNMGHVPSFIKDPEHCFFNVHWEDKSLYYETKWSPNVQDLRLVGDYFSVDFISRYEERGSSEYGLVEYTGGILKEVSLTEDDFSLITEFEDTYLFEDTYWGSEEDILEVLLERKAIKEGMRFTVN